jgi:uncharacterized integral membrane protein
MINLSALMFALVGTLIITCLVEGLVGCIRMYRYNRKVKTEESNDD